MKVPSFIPKQVDVETTTERLNALANVMQNIANITKNSAGEWLNWGANVMSAIAMTIPEITKLIALKKTEAVVNGVASATQTPIVGWLLAGASVASVLGALMAIPKFAQGGIIGGNYYNDSLLAYVSSGEMILNKTQQSNLFSLLDRGTTYMGNGDVVFKLKGTDLVGVLNNYNNKLSKIK